MITIEKRHEQFVAEICKTQTVYGLEGPEGFATSDSTHFEDENDEPVGIICFWSTEILARSCAENDWEKFEPVAISLLEFIENWCVGMSNDALLVGTDFDKNLFGHEIDPLELVLEIIAELKKTNTIIEFEKFDDIDDLEAQIREVLE